MSNARTRQLTRHSLALSAIEGPLVYLEPFGRRATLKFFFLACAALLCARSAFSLDPSLDISQYAHTAWKVRDGFTRGAITAIAQTPDGYLWLGTEFGLYRFDGVRAVPWGPPAGERLPSMNILRLLVTRDGTLWIATQKGLASSRDGKLNQYPAFAGHNIVSLFEDRQGTIWVGEWQIEPRGRLCAIRDGVVDCSDSNGGLESGALSLYEDRTGDLWVGSLEGFWHWRPGPPKFYALGKLGINSFAHDPDGALLIGGRGIWRFRDGKIDESPHLLPNSIRGLAVSRMLRDRDGALWIGIYSGGLLHAHSGRQDTFAQADGLSGNLVTCLFEDREGTLWVATRDGLDRFRNFTAPTWSGRQGLSLAPGGAVLAGSDSSIWVGLVKGLGRLSHGQVTIYRKYSEGNTPLADQGVRETIYRGMPERFYALLEDHNGRLWISSASGVGYLDREEFHAIAPPHEGIVASLAEDHNGDLWVEDQEYGLFRTGDGRVAQHFAWEMLGRRAFGWSLAVDPLRGGVWVGFVSGGVSYFRDGQARASYSVSDGLGEGYVRDLRFGSGGTLWAATEGGLSRIKDGNIATLTSKNGLPCNTVHWSIEDDDHFVWLYMPCGLVRIAVSELDGWASDPKRKVQATVFDESEGVRGAGDISGYHPQASKAPDGRIWFAAPDGISVIDPLHLPYNKIAPPVHIEQITADGKEYGPARGPLPPLVRDLTIDYTALSLVVPEKVHFRVKLEGQDKDWRELTDRRINYTNLAPKHYRFLVKACNNSGVWNEEGAALDFVIPPAWYQTNWFRALCVAAFLALLWAMYQLRLRQLAQQFNMRLEERVGERTRIARDLHDTLLQSFQGVVFRFQATCNHLPDRPQAAREALDSALVSADQALAEGRSSIQELRSEPLKESNMEQVLLAMGRELASSQDGEHGSPPLRVIVEGTRRAKQAMIREEIYRIAREVLRNAYRHAHARSIEAELRYDDDAFVLIVRDDGKGIDPKVLKEHGRAGHWGLSGAYERAEGIGARLDVWSEAGAGTEVRLTVPGAIAYEKSGDGGRFKLFRKTRIYERRS